MIKHLFLILLSLFSTVVNAVVFINSTTQPWTVEIGFGSRANEMFRLSTIIVRPMTARVIDCSTKGFEEVAEITRIVSVTDGNRNLNIDQERRALGGALNGLEIEKKPTSIVISTKLPQAAPVAPPAPFPGSQQMTAGVTPKKNPASTLSTDLENAYNQDLKNIDAKRGSRTASVVQETLNMKPISQDLEKKLQAYNDVYKMLRNASNPDVSLLSKQFTALKDALRKTK